MIAAKRCINITGLVRPVTEFVNNLEPLTPPPLQPDWRRLCDTLCSIWGGGGGGERATRRGKTWVGVSRVKNRHELRKEPGSRKTSAQSSWAGVGCPV